jgi:hypothetical protein
MTEIKKTTYWGFSVISTLYKKTGNLEENVHSVNMISGNKHFQDFPHLDGFFIMNTFCYVSKRNTKMNFCQAVYFFLLGLCKFWSIFLGFLFFFFFLREWKKKDIKSRWIDLFVKSFCLSRPQNCYRFFFKVHSNGHASILKFLNNSSIVRRKAKKYKKNAPVAFEKLMIHGIRMSHYLSRFAAFVIDARTKISTVGSLFITNFCYFHWCLFIG